MNSVELSEIEKKIHQWITQVMSACISHDWEFETLKNGEFSNEDTNEDTIQWPGICLNDQVIEKVADILLDEKMGPSLQTKMDVFDRVFEYLCEVIQVEDIDMDFVNDDEKMAEYITNIYNTQLSIRMSVEKIVSKRLQKDMEVNGKKKNKM